MFWQQSRLATIPSAVGIGKSLKIRRKNWQKKLQITY
jgi:ribosomal protein L37E